MIVSKEKLRPYSVEYFFPRRVGEGSRDAYFNANPSALITGEYCAIGTDEAGYELEMYNGVNWVVVTPDTSYSLIITNNGLAALTNVRQGTTTLRFSGIKIIDQTILNPVTPIIQWTDTNFLAAGNVVFSVGTLGSVHSDPTQLTQLLKWRINSSSGGLQYILTLPADGLGSTADDNSTTWQIGAIGLYVKNPNDQTSDVLFAVATLPELVTKHASDVNIVGNSIKLYFNTILTNLGILSNLEILPDANVSLPEVQNETLLTYPKNIEKDPYNCYVVDNLYGTNMPALAVKRDYNLPEQSVQEEYNDWVWLQPSDNFIIVPADSFDNVDNYDFVYWDTTVSKYKKAQGQTDTTVSNIKTPIGVRVGNSIVFSGTITNNATSYTYATFLSNGGSNYAIGDELLLPVTGSLTIKIRITAINTNGAITQFIQVGPTAGNIVVPGDDGGITISAIYDPHSQLPRNGTGARINVTGNRIPGDTTWDLSAYLNQPVYCSATNPGKVTGEKTDSMIGWAVAANTIKLDLDIQNEASSTDYGTVKYATNSQVKNEYANIGIADKRVVSLKDLKNNYLQITVSDNPTTNQAGDTLTNPIIVDTYVKFNKTVLGKHAVTPYTDTAANPYITDANIDFYGEAFRAWYKDVAEYYEADKYYEPGTLITFGKGIKEISIADKECNGIISTHPGYELGMATTETSLPVALVGRVPVLFDGNCMPKFGDKIYLSKVVPGKASTVENGKCLGKIIAKNFGTSKLIECVVRIDF